MVDPRVIQWRMMVDLAVEAAIRSPESRAQENEAPLLLKRSVASTREPAVRSNVLLGRAALWSATHSRTFRGLMSYAKRWP